MSKRRQKRRLRKARKNACAFVRSFDKFGTPIPLNYEGSDTYKTTGGALLSLCAILLITVGLLKGFRNLVLNKDWTEKSLIEILKKKELEVPVALGSYQNFSAGIELKPSEGSSINSREEYLEAT